MAKAEIDAKRAIHGANEFQALGSYNGKTGELAFQPSKFCKICLILSSLWRFLASLA